MGALAIACKSLILCVLCVLLWLNYSFYGYRAANWMGLGLTTGRGHNAPTGRRDQPRKELWVYPLAADFRRHLNPTA